MDFSHLADNLWYLRKARGLSQDALALTLGPPFSQPYLSRLERGLRPADLRHVEALAHAFVISLRTLLQRPRGARRLMTFPLRDTRTRPPAPARSPRVVDTDPLEAA